MSSTIELGSIVADVHHKEIKNIHLSVNPPQGDVRISAPMHLDMDTIRIFALSKLSWIRRQQQKFRDQERETPREYIDRESHYVWGKRYLMLLKEEDVPAHVALSHNKLVVNVRPDSSMARREEVLEKWYRGQLRSKASEMIEIWEKRIGVESDRVIIQKMKTKWGSCSPKTRIIRLNLELCKKPPQHLEYIIVHELVHLIEPTHNHRFINLMDTHMPKWKHYREELNRLAIGEIKTKKGKQ